MAKTDPKSDSDCPDRFDSAVRVTRSPSYPTDISDDELGFVVPYLISTVESAVRREYGVRHLLNAVRYLAGTGISWRMMPNDLPHWTIVHQELGRWIEAQCHLRLVGDLELLLATFPATSARSNTLNGRQPINSSSIRPNRTKAARAAPNLPRVPNPELDTLRHQLISQTGDLPEKGSAELQELTSRLQEYSCEVVAVSPACTKRTKAFPEIGLQRTLQMEAFQLGGTSRRFLLLPRRWLDQEPFAWTPRFRRLILQYGGWPDLWKGIVPPRGAWKR